MSDKLSTVKTLAALALAASTAACASSDQLASFARDPSSAPGAAYDAARRSTADAYHAVRNAAAPPAFAPVGNPAALTGGQAQTIPQPQPVAYAAPAPSSLWQAGSRSFFNDQRASRIGDILKVEIEISDKAEITNSSSRQRASETSSGVDSFLGIPTQLGRFFGAGFDPTNLVSGHANSTAAGQGAINREEKVELTVAAVIVDRLPNGNLVIAGRQEVRINSELRELTVSGIVRPEDITASNTIRHDQIAEARVSYGGRGQISAVQRPNIGQRIGDAISPW
jgi:flagellar L-ring protein precursor FlgH